MASFIIHPKGVVESSLMLPGETDFHTHFLAGESYVIPKDWNKNTWKIMGWVWKPINHSGSQLGSHGPFDVLMSAPSETHEWGVCPKFDAQAIIKESLRKTLRASNDLNLDFAAHLVRAKVFGSCKSKVQNPVKQLGCAQKDEKRIGRVVQLSILPFQLLEAQFCPIIAGTLSHNFQMTWRPLKLESN